MSQALDDLDPRFKVLAIELLARLVEAKLPVLIVETRRTPAQQAINLAKGVSWVVHSKHLDGLAMDLVPYSVYTLAPGGDKLEWDGSNPAWQTIGRIAKSLGLRWGGDWQQRDLGHVEYVEPAATKAA